MIDPLDSLAFSVQANPGVYALLLGSGLSRSAKIPTGWEITLDLIRKIAAIREEQCEPNPEAWYIETFDKSPEYSDLLDALAKTPSERQQMLRGYLEPTETEREDGAKQPTPAHRAIASLVSKGFVRVIITTNFDRLLETALADEGVAPTILSSPDQVRGALPLIHTKCCILKLHGDYLDTRIRNTTAELAKYPPAFARLLDRIFDEFGLVVCGWSARWDAGLRAAIVRAPSRRFTTFWAAVGEIGPDAQELIGQRLGQVIPIVDADSFFERLARTVESLDRYGKPHPLSTEAAVANLKRYMSEPRFRIQLSDLIDEVVDRTLEATSLPVFASGGVPETGSATERMHGYEAACATLLAIAPIGGYWSSKADAPVWQRAIARLAPSEDGAGSLWSDMRRYPAALLLYGLGLGAVEREDIPFLAKLLETEIRVRPGERVRVVQLLPSGRLLGSGGENGKVLEGMADRLTPVSDWLHGVLRPTAVRLMSDDERYDYVFDKLELLLALHYGNQKEAGGFYWAPLGRFGWRHTKRQAILDEMNESVSLGLASPFVKAELFGRTPEECLASIREFEQFISRAVAGWH